MGRIVGFAFLASVAEVVLYGALAPLLPELSAEHGLSKGEAGVLMGSYSAGLALAALPLGVLASQVGPRRVAVLGMALLALTSAIFALADAIGLLVAMRFAQGIAGAAVWGGALVWLVAAVDRERRGAAIGVAVGGGLIGHVVGPAIGAAAVSAGTEPVFLATSAAMLALGGWALTIPSAGVRAQGAPARRLGALGSAPVVGAMALVTLPALIVGSLEVLVPLRLGDLGAGGATIGAVFVGLSLLTASANPFIGAWSDARGRFVPIRAGLALASIMSLVLILPDSIPPYVAVTAGLWLATAAFWSPVMALMADTAEGTGIDQGLAWGAINLAFAVGLAAGSVGGAFLAEATSDGAVYGTIFLFCVVSLAAVSASLPIARPTCDQ